MSFKDEDTTGDIDAAIVAGTLIGEPRIIIEGELAAVLVPPGAKLEQIDLRAFEAKYADHPLRKTGTRALATAEAFIAYVKAHSDSSSTIYSSKAHTKFEVVFNDHEKNPDALESGRPGHQDFRAVYACPLSVEWQRWMARSQHAAEQKKGMPQAEFMMFLEDNLLDITMPDSAMLLGAVRSFEAHSEAKFKNAVNLDNGSVEFRFTETVNEVAQDGKLSLPSLFEITVPVFDGGERYVIQARLRYRISGGGLVLWYELVRPHKIVEYAFNKVREQVIAGVGTVPVYDV